MDPLPQFQRKVLRLLTVAPKPIPAHLVARTLNCSEKYASTALRDLRRRRLAHAIPGIPHQWHPTNIGYAVNPAALVKAMKNAQAKPTPAPPPRRKKPNKKQVFGEFATAQLKQAPRDQAKLQIATLTMLRAATGPVSTAMLVTHTRATIGNIRRATSELLTEGFIARGTPNRPRWQVTDQGADINIYRNKARFGTFLEKQRARQKAIITKCLAGGAVATTETLAKAIGQAESTTRGILKALHKTGTVTSKHGKRNYSMWSLK